MFFRVVAGSVPDDLCPPQVSPVVLDFYQDAVRLLALGQEQAELIRAFQDIQGNEQRSEAAVAYYQGVVRDQAYTDKKISCAVRDGASTRFLPGDTGKRDLFPGEWISDASPDPPVVLCMQTNADQTTAKA
jgi:hypothetical protein